MVDSTPDTDLGPLETQEWQDALSTVIEREGQERAHFLLETLIDQARRSGTHIPFRPTTAYSIPSLRPERFWRFWYRKAGRYPRETRWPRP
ncbi:MAG: hypothetical protein QGH58_04500 [Arenicellales bacterium]|jgi:pyruvate dehydrogenase complex dehydrogenase (E1) component|nr:hypothetical protein [Arenicellales bacterium]MDP6552975.1 hypothetical protein [Arenicellales bacterium]MDP6791153.1 hypothetical protein [Arenicellales bacterium]MDP6918847.1 hypothetical protein [Arenicellales bacterium]|tara:strand:+ start:20198 stop:20470 length:273 start_codon:yes stop_codon:yes gene_type:complete